MSTVQSNPGYVDHHYLQAVLQLSLPLKQRSHEKMHLRPGQSILDVGCGPGLDTIPLANLVGPTGKVVGIDFDSEMIQLARQSAHQAGVERWAEHQVGEVPPIPHPDNSYDATHSERLFQHIADPLRLLSEMKRVTRPGGWVVAADVDHTSLSIDLADPALSDLDWRLRRFQAEKYVNGLAGRQLFRLFKVCNLSDISVELFPLYVTDYKLGRYFARLSESEAKALAAGVVNAEELVHLHAAYEHAEHNGQFFGYIVMILVAGQKLLD